MDNRERHKFSTIFLSQCSLVLIIITTHFASADDAEIMVKLARSLSPKPIGWTGSNPCRWAGVKCDSSGKVVNIDISGKSLSGQLPSDLNQLSKLKSLYVQRNSLSGALPQLSNLGYLQNVNFDSNNFSSVPSGFLSGLTNLQTFSIDDNPKLSPWSIPGTLKDSTALQTFQASRANLAGEIPDIFGNFPNLEILRLSYNNITGTLPKSFDKSGIQILMLNNQLIGLSGRIDVLGTMSELTQVWIHVNRFTGPIPDLSLCTQLSDIELRDNLFTGMIPSSLISLPKLKSVGLQNNKFQGPFPNFPRSVNVTLGNQNNFCNPSPGPCDPRVTKLLAVVEDFGYPMILAESWSGNNPCRGWDFVTCDSKGSIIVINFAKQNWVGTISPLIANLTDLQTIRLNDNKLTGSIPSVLTSLKQLKLLDVSNNNLSGKVPSFPADVIAKTSGNVNIGKDLPPPEDTRKGGSSSSPAGTKVHAGKSSTWVIIVVVVVAIVLIAIACFVVYKRHVRKRGSYYNWVKGRDSGGTEKEISEAKSPSQSSDYQVSDGGNATIPIEVLREVTDNFSESNILGKGGFGIVYKGQLHDGTKIAVKRMDSNQMGDKGLNEFRAEIEVLSKVRHRSLVALHGFCENGNERLLVYEYMPQGSLGQHLFPHKKVGFVPLTWNQRVTIALDVARGVEYLHSLAKQSFIHRDLKPSNILLGDDMRAKVSDFGLVKSTPDGKYSMETRLAGTFGYLAPEYATTGKVTTKVDVFAFGVILMEMVTGRKALDDTLPEEQAHLVSWFRKLLQDKESVKAAIDPTLTRDEETFDSIWKVAELAGHCTTREAQQRPDMSHAVNVLSPLVEQWKPSPEEEDDIFGIDFHMTLPQALEKWKANEGSSMTSDFYNSKYSTTFSTSRDASKSDSRIFGS